MFAYADKIFFPAVCTIPTTWTNLTLYFHKYFFIHLLKEHNLGGPACINDILNHIIIAIYEKILTQLKGTDVLCVGNYGYIFFII